MIWALIRKDARLLRHYLYSALVTTIGCYAICSILVIILTNYQDESMQRVVSRAMLVCMGGSNCGYPATYFFAALLAGSAFTLERSDRSAEFLACLPPTRTQHLVSKLTVVLGSISIMLVVHSLFAWCTHLLLPFVHGQNLMHANERLPSVLITCNFVPMIVAVTGGALVVSAWMKSNGVPILCGLLTPILVVSVVSLIGYALAIPSEADAFVIRFASTSFVMGITFGYIGCYWYLTRNEP